MAKLKNIQRLKLVIPTKNVRFKDENTLKGSVLKAIYEFFSKNKLEEQQSLIDTLAWFLFRRYKLGQKTEEEKRWNLATNPLSPDGSQVVLLEKEMDSKNYTFPCPETGGKIYLTDIFRLHEIIDEEIEAAGILGYLVNVVEHIIIIHIIRQLLSIQPTMLKKVFLSKTVQRVFLDKRLHCMTQCKI